MSQGGTEFRPMNNASLRIAIGADHGGVEVKSAIVEGLELTGNQVVD